MNCVVYKETIVASNETNQEEVYVSKVVILVPNVMFANDNHQMLINIAKEWGLGLKIFITTYTIDIQAFFNFIPPSLSM